jgi:AraC family transcriptional regulator of adaptative response / DNA-3-methyladenine glycosylase II
MDIPSDDICYRAFRAHDTRFDGRVFVGVTSTGIYCRPVCPANPPKKENCKFYPSAAAAQEAGFRPCLRCRPEISPDVAAWRGTSNTVSRALAKIAQGALDADGASVDAFAEQLGVGERQLRRLFEQHLGASPIQVAQTRRILFAKQLIQDTQLPMTEIAGASGFGSIRRFNDAFQKLFRRTPTELRKPKSRGLAPVTSSVTLRLGYRPPYDWDAMIAFLQGHMVPGVEAVWDNRYARTLEINGQIGSVEVAPGKNYLQATIRFPDLKALLPIVARLRRLFDLDADVDAIGAHLSADPGLAPLIKRRPGLRAPGGWDGFEFAVRSVLGQQVTVRAACKFAGQLVEAAGKRVTVAQTGNERLTHVFPTPTQLAASDLLTVGLTGQRRKTLHNLAAAAQKDPSLFDLDQVQANVMSRLLDLPGFGEWTAQYWALRAGRDADAFPAADVALLRSPAVAEKNNARPTPKALLERAESWRPWRAYAAQHLWTADGDPKVANV